MNKALLLILLFYCSNSNAQLFNKVIKHTERNFGKAIIRTSDNHILIAGTSLTTPREMFLFKADSAGNILWKKNIMSRIGQIGDCKIYESNDGNYNIAGGSSAPSPVYNYNVLIKVDTACNIIWFKTYDNTTIGGLINVTRAVDNGFVFINGGSGSSKMDISKVDSSGNLEWIKNYYFSGASATFSSIDRIEATNDGDLLIPAMMFCYSSSCQYPIKIKLNAQGDIIWSREIFETGNLSENFIKSGNNYYISFETATKGLIKLDTSGNIISTHEFTIPNTSVYVYTIKSDNNSGLYLAGNAKTINWFPFVAHADSTGFIDFFRVYPYAGVDQFCTDFCFKNNDFYLTGRTDAPYADTTDVILIKDNLLSSVCNSQDLSIVNNEVQFLDSAVVMTSSIDSLFSTNDSIFVMNDTAYSDTVICDLTSAIANPPANSTIEIYPNPGSGIFTLKFSELKNVETEFRVYDLVGKNVFVRKLSGNLTDKIDLGFLNSGIYLFKLSDGNQNVFQGKLVITQ